MRAADAELVAVCGRQAPAICTSAAIATSCVFIGSEARKSTGASKLQTITEGCLAGTRIAAIIARHAWWGRARTAY